MSRCARARPQWRRRWLPNDQGEATEGNMLSNPTEDEAERLQ